MSELESRFWPKVDRGEPDECWEWLAAQRPDGYGQISVEGEHRLADRVAYRLAVEKPGDDLVLHECDNRPCCNPAHLYLGDHSQNLQDAWDRDRRDGSGENHLQAELTREDVKEIQSQSEDGIPNKELAAEYGVAPSTISRVVTGDNWSDIEREKEASR